METRLIDTHVHIWNFQRAEYEWLKNDTSILNRNYDIEALEAERKRAGVTDGILVQAANNREDTDWMLETASRSEWIKGVVGWLPLMDPKETNKQLSLSLLSNKYFKGIRHLIHDEPDPKWLLQDKVIDSLKILAAYGIPYDVVGVKPEHIETVLQVIRKVPDIRMVFDHLNQPPVTSKDQNTSWHRLMEEAASHQNLYAKISGLGTATQKPGAWTVEDIQPAVEFALEKFGADRCFCGGDWPVSLLAGSYEKTWQVYKEVLAKLLKPEELEKVYYKNAEAFYRL